MLHSELIKDKLLSFFSHFQRNKKTKTKRLLKVQNIHPTGINQHLSWRLLADDSLRHLHGSLLPMFLLCPVQ